jgi:hypothetical protein
MRLCAKPDLEKTAEQVTRHVHAIAHETRTSEQKSRKGLAYTCRIRVMVWNP